MRFLTVVADAAAQGVTAESYGDEPNLEQQGKITETLGRDRYAVETVAPSRGRSHAQVKVYPDKKWATYAYARAEIGGDFGANHFGAIASAEARVRYVGTLTANIKNADPFTPYNHTFRVNVHGKSETWEEMDLNLLTGSTHATQRFEVIINGTTYFNLSESVKRDRNEVVHQNAIASGYYEFTVPFFTGQSYSISLLMESTASAGLFYYQGAYEAEADYASTFTWEGLVDVRNRRGFPVPLADVTLLDEEGVDFALPFVVPEPATVAFAPFALAFLASRARRRARR